MDKIHTQGFEELSTDELQNADGGKKLLALFLIMRAFNGSSGLITGLFSGLFSR